FYGAVSIKRLGGDSMKFSSHRVNVGKGQFVRVGAIGEENKSALVLGIDPATRAGEPVVTKSVWWKCLTGRRFRSRGKLPGKRPRFVQFGGHVLSKQIASSRR